MCFCCVCLFVFLIPLSYFYVCVAHCIADFGVAFFFILCLFYSFTLCFGDVPNKNDGSESSGWFQVVSFDFLALILRLLPPRTAFAFCSETRASHCGGLRRPGDFGARFDGHRARVDAGDLGLISDDRTSRCVEICRALYRCFYRFWPNVKM